VTPNVSQAIEDYLQQLTAAGSSTADTEFAREFLTDAGSGEKTEDEQLLAVRAAWSFVRDVAKRKGGNL
jgi:hypothetical protein